MSPQFPSSYSESNKPFTHLLVEKKRFQDQNNLPNENTTVKGLLIGN
jgi:hypothetical protein